MGKLVDLTGERRGKLVVIERVENSKKGSARWKCECDCGTIRIVRTGNLESGNTKSCGCARGDSLAKDITGMKKNKLTALKCIGVGSGSRRWLFKCDCGNETECTIGNFTTGAVKSCGCLQKLQGAENPRYKGKEHISGAIWKQIKNGASKRNLNFELTIDYVLELYKLQNFKCALSGEDVYIGSRMLKFETTASLDRIDSSKGYVKGNVQWVHKDYNMSKWNFTQERYEEMCCNVAKMVAKRKRMEKKAA